MPARARELGAPARLAAFALGLALVGGAAAIAGAATGHGRAASRATHAGEMSMGRLSPAELSRTSGLTSDAGGYALVPAQTSVPRGRTSDFRFGILDAEGRPVRGFAVDGGVRVHLIVVRRDLVGYQHLHPRQLADGTWSVPLTLRAPGAYRAFADFEIGGVKTVLGHDLFVAGSFTPARLPVPALVSATDGFTVRLAHGALRAGAESPLRFAISRGGRPVPSFDAYVGHRGHLVALHDGDLSYSHVHPEPTAQVGEIVFHGELPSAGRYRLFLQFKVDGTVHTAPFTLEVGR